MTVIKILISFPEINPNEGNDEDLSGEVPSGYLYFWLPLTLGSILDEDAEENAPAKLVDLLSKKLIKMVINKLLEYEVGL